MDAFCREEGRTQARLPRPPPPPRAGRRTPHTLTGGNWPASSPGPCPGPDVDFPCSPGELGFQDGKASGSLEGSSDPRMGCMLPTPPEGLSLCGSSLLGPQRRAGAAGCPLPCHLPPLLRTGCCLRPFPLGAPTGPSGLAMSPETAPPPVLIFSISGPSLLQRPRARRHQVILDPSASLIPYSQPVTRPGPFSSSLSGSCLFRPRPTATTISGLQ